MTLEDEEELASSVLPAVDLRFDNSLADLGSDGVTWTKTTQGVYDATSFHEGTHSLRRNNEGSNQGFSTTGLAIDYTHDNTIEFYLANVVKPTASRVLFFCSNGTNGRGLNLQLFTSGFLYAGYTAGSGGSVSVFGSVDITGSATYQKITLLWRANDKTVELLVNDVSQGVSAEAADNTPGVTVFDILGDAGTSVTAGRANIDYFRVMHGI